MSSKLVLIEYVDDVESSAGRPDEDDKQMTVEKGTRRLVDAASARSLVERKVAKVVTEDDDKAPAPAKAAAVKPVEGGGS